MKAAICNLLRKLRTHTLIVGIGVFLALGFSLAYSAGSILLVLDRCAKTK